MAGDPSISYSFTVNYDTNAITAITATDSNDGITCSLSNSTIQIVSAYNSGDGVDNYITVTLNDGYEITSVIAGLTSSESVSIPLTSANTFTINPLDSAFGNTVDNPYITITTKTTSGGGEIVSDTSEINALLAELITDRTQTDIDNRTEKAYYNVSDYARINEAIQYLSDASEINLGLSTTEITLGQAVTATQFDEILNNISTIRENWYIAEETPAVPTRLQWDYNKANDIEHILTNSLEFLKSVRIDKLYSGTFRAGSHIKFRGDK